MSDMLRITGLVSGMDTDATVKKLIQIEQAKVDKAKQEKQYLEWQKEDYREIANLLRGLQDEYFDVLNSDTYMLSANTFNMFAASATVGGTASSAVSITTTSSSVVGSFTIDSVTQLATKDKWESNGEVFGDITSTTMADFTGTVASYENNKNLVFTLDGVSKLITLDDGLNSSAAIASNLTTKLQEAFTNVDIQVDVSGTDPNATMEFNIFQSGTTTDEPGHAFKIENANSDLLTDLGLKAYQSNSVITSNSLETTFGITSDQTITINNKEFTFNKDTTVANMMQEINTSNIGVTMTYDSFNDKFTLESNVAGTQNVISVTDSADTLFATMKIADGNATKTAAQNSIFTVNGAQTTRSSNTFEMNGAQVTLNEIPTGPITVNIDTDTKNAKDLIVKFVEKYNEMIKKINDKFSERKNYDYKPLTEAQKKDMSEDDIKAWEKEARKGGLRNDVTLENITLQMRQALYESVEGLNISLSDIGIQTSNNYKDAGKLVIDEIKLDKALEERPNEVIELFTKESSTTYSSYTNRSERYSQNGIGQRLSDILNDNIRITRDPDGNKGYLIDKAGLETGVDATSEMAKKIIEMDDKIADLLKMLGDKEEKYYQDFARMESAMSAYSSQSAWLTQQFGG